MVIIDISYS